MTTSATTQQTQSVDSTSTVLLEDVENNDKLLPNETPENSTSLLGFLKVGD